MTEATITQRQQQRDVVKGVEVKGGCGFSPSDFSRIRLICCIRWPGVILTAEVWRLTSPANRRGSCPTRAVCVFLRFTFTLLSVVVGFFIYFFCYTSKELKVLFRKITPWYEIFALKRIFWDPLLNYATRLANWFSCENEPVRQQIKKGAQATATNRWICKGRIPAACKD